MVSGESEWKGFEAVMVTGGDGEPIITRRCQESDR